MNARDFVSKLASRGRYFFTTAEAMKSFGSSLASTRAGLRVLKSRGEIAVPYRGCHVIVPPEYRAIGCLPPEQFIPTLMRHLQAPYYVGLLSAAEFHGAAHQRPQAFQVLTDAARPRIRCGQVHVRFFRRKQVDQVPTVSFDTPRGPVQVSTPEATGIDLVAFARSCGGLDLVATVLAELAESIHPEKLAEIAGVIAEPPWIQRLGFLLEKVGSGHDTDPLAQVVERLKPRYTPLQPGVAKDNRRRDARWRLLVNVEVEPDL